MGIPLNSHYTVGQQGAYGVFYWRFLYLNPHEKVIGKPPTISVCSALHDNVVLIFAWICLTFHRAVNVTFVKINFTFLISEAKNACKTVKQHEPRCSAEVSRFSMLGEHALSRTHVWHLKPTIASTCPPQGFFLKFDIKCCKVCTYCSHLNFQIRRHVAQT